MARERILALIMAGGSGSRMELLTRVRAKPVLPFAGVYRLIDFPLSNCVHSGLDDVWVIEQFMPHNLNDHLANGRPWDLDRTYGGLRIIPPHTGPADAGWHQGNADAIYRNRRYIKAFDPDLVLVLSADHIYRLNYQDVIDYHLERAADVTMVTTEVPIDEAGRFGTVEVDADGKVTAFAYKPDQPQSPIVTTEVFVYSAQVLLETIEELAAQADPEDDEQPALSDFGDELLPRLVEAGRAYAFPLPGYWRDVGVIDDYWQAHMDLLDTDQAADHRSLDLDDAAWPILTYGVQRMPARLLTGAATAHSLISPGCQIHGKVEHSVLGPGVVVEAGALVRRSVIFSDCRIERDAVVDAAIVDSNVVVGRRARVGHSDPGAARPAITIVARGAMIAPDAEIAPGEQVHSRETDEDQP